MFTITTALKKLLKLKKRFRFVCGGTSAAKTISIEQILIDLAQRDKVPTLTSIVSESFPHLKRGAMRDFLKIMQEHGYYKDERWNKTDYIYTFETGSKIEFFSVDQPSKVRGPRRDRLFCNELNNIPREAFEQLEVRTKDFIFADWNPANDFYAYEDYIGKRDDVDFVTLTYLDNEGLPKQIVDAIEARRNNKAWWTVYGLGQLGDIEAKIYKNWQIIDEIPHEAKIERRGLDFGYSNDPTACVAVYKWNGAFIFDEELYRKGLLNKPIADFINSCDQSQTLVIADSAEPKSIDELKLYGINILPATKGKGSVTQGIQYVQAQQVFVTKRSVNLIKEYRNYLWQTRDDGKILNVPEQGNDHALDAIRYALSTYRPALEFEEDFYDVKTDW